MSILMAYNSNISSKKLKGFDKIWHFCTKINIFYKNMAQPFDKSNFVTL